MAKRETALSVAEQKLEDFVEDMGQVLSAVRTRAEGWLSQRQRITKTLSEIRDTASGLLQELGNQAGAAVQRVGGGRRRGRRRRARSGTAAATATAGSRKRRVFSAETRARMADAQRRRWAAHRASKQK